MSGATVIGATPLLSAVWIGARVLECRQYRLRGWRRVSGTKSSFEGSSERKVYPSKPFAALARAARDDIDHPGHPRLACARFIVAPTQSSFAIPGVTGVVPSSSVVPSLFTPCRTSPRVPPALGTLLPPHSINLTSCAVRCICTNTAQIRTPLHSLRPHKQRSNCFWLHYSKHRLAPCHPPAPECVARLPLHISFTTTCSRILRQTTRPRFLLIWREIWCLKYESRWPHSTAI